MQRLFSNFASGWPGAGLLLQRGLVGVLLFRDGLVPLLHKPHALFGIQEFVGLASAILLVFGLWTPFAGIAAAAAELWILFSRPGEPLILAMGAILAASVAMIGPGAWSLDARLFGRKRIDAVLPPKSSSRLRH